jgi:hypothetical protein
VLLKATLKLATYERPLTDQNRPLAKLNGLWQQSTQSGTQRLVNISVREYPEEASGMLESVFWQFTLTF